MMYANKLIILYSLEAKIKIIIIKDSKITLTGKQKKRAKILARPFFKENKLRRKHK